MSFNLNSNFGLDDLRDSGSRETPALYEARRHCVSLAQAWVFSLVFGLLAVAYF